MSSKKLINSAEAAVDDCLRGLVALNPDVSLLDGHERVVLRADLHSGALEGKVALVCGGGSGHEPSHAGFVARGMLAGAVCGAVFASPPVSAVLACVRAVWSAARPAGILMIVKNYTGDRVNFGLALERAKAEGVNCEMVVVADDCALTSKDRSAGRRGLAGTVFVHKIAGAMAEQGCQMEEIVRFLGSKVLPHMGTIGLSLGPCCPPGSQPSFQLEGDEAELGLGIHGEAGVRKIKLDSTRESVRTMLDHMTSPSSQTRLDLPGGSEVVVLVNNLGGTSNLELGIVVKEVMEQLRERKMKVRRAFAGPLMTSLEMAGVSVTILNCSDVSDEILACLDLPVCSVNWPRSPDSVERSADVPAVFPMPDIGQRGAAGTAAATAKGRKFSPFEQSVSDDGVRFTCEALKSCEAMLNKFDSGSGDGDCGSTLRRGAVKLLEKLPGGGLDGAAEVLDAVSHIAEEDMGGSAGAMYSILFATTSAITRTAGKSFLPLTIFQGLEEGCKAMMT